MKGCLAVLCIMMLGSSPVYAGEKGGRDFPCSCEEMRTDKELKDSADKLVDEAKDACRDFTDEITDKVQKSADRAVEKAKESVKRSITESVRKYFSTLKTRISEFIKTLFHDVKGETD